MSYNYLESTKSNIMDYINNEIDLTEWKGNRDALEEYLNEVLWTQDSVTGNASGSYTFSRSKAREFVIDNMGDLCDACAEFGISYDTIGEKFIMEDWEYFDVTIRCYYLAQAISECLDDIEDELEESEDED